MLTQDFIDAWIEDNGPWVYHVTKRVPHLRERILRLGLLPNGVQGACSPHSLLMAPRPGHVYFRTAESFPVLVQQMYHSKVWANLQKRKEILDSTVAIDLRGLDPRSIAPDEDCCYESTLVVEAHGGSFIEVPGIAQARQVVNDTTFAQRYTDPGCCADRPYSSYGQWAEAEGIGECPEHTAACWGTFGSLAYRGPIPAHFLRPVEEAELSQEDSSQDEALLCAA